MYIGHVGSFTAPKFSVLVFSHHINLAKFENLPLTFPTSYFTKWLIVESTGILNKEYISLYGCVLTLEVIYRTFFIEPPNERVGDLLCTSRLERFRSWKLKSESADLVLFELFRYSSGTERITYAPGTVYGNRQATKGSVDSLTVDSTSYQTHAWALEDAKVGRVYDIQAITSACKYSWQLLSSHVNGFNSKNKVLGPVVQS